MEQLLKITTVPISYELKVNNARLERKSGSVDMEITRSRGGMRIKSRPAKIHIDTYEARNSVTPSLKNSIYQAADRGMQQAQQVTAQYAAEGRMYLRSRPGEGGEAIQQMLVNRTMLPTGEFELDFIPKGGADISVSEPAFSIRYQMDKLNFDWKVNEGSVEFIPGSVEISVTQFPDVKIEYVGDPIYVPPSVAERFTGESPAESE